MSLPVYITEIIGVPMTGKLWLSGWNVPDVKEDTFFCAVTLSKDEARETKITHRG